MKPIHPLSQWLARKKMATATFAKLSGIPFGHLYQYVAGKVPDPRIWTLIRVERATHTVTVKKQAEYVEALNNGKMPDRETKKKNK